MPKRTLAAAEAAAAETATEAQRYRTVIDELANELVCPITTELPIDPVTAADGRVYERSAIKEWFQSREGQPIKSPVTNMSMGTQLLPAVQVRNNIKSMVRTGAISGAKADAWKKKMEEEEMLAGLRLKAEAGDPVAMWKLGTAYRDGKYGLTTDLKEAFKYVKQAADKDYVSALSECARMYLGGIGVSQSLPRGFVMLGQAINAGSDHACYLLGHFHIHGSYGCDKDPLEVAKWYRKMASQPNKIAMHTTCDEAARWLREFHP